VKTSKINTSAAKPRVGNTPPEDTTTSQLLSTFSQHLKT